MTTDHKDENDVIASRFEEVLRLRFPPSKGDLWFTELAERLAGVARSMIQSATDDLHAHADVIAQQRNALGRHGGVKPSPDDEHTSDGRCKYPMTCAREPLYRPASSDDNWWCRTCVLWHPKDMGASPAEAHAEWERREVARQRLNTLAEQDIRPGGGDG